MRKARSFVLEFTRTETPEDPHAFRFVPQDYTLHVDGRLSGRLRVPWDQALLAAIVAVRRPGRDPSELQRLGERLRDVLDPAGWRALGEEIARTLDAHRAVSVTVRSNAAELFALPWELLTVGTSGQHLGERSQVLVRYEWPGTTTREGPTPRPEGGRIVVAWSAAGGPVPADAHLQAIATACERGHVDFDPTRDVVGHCDLERLAAAIDGGDGRPPATILHWLCHGGAVGSTFGLVVNDAEGNPCTVDAGRVRQILAPRADHLRLVVLAACDGGNAGDPGNHLGSVAQAIHRIGVASVVASRYPLSIDGSEVLAAELYGALFVDLCALETAFLRARVSLAKDPTHLDWASLTLHARAGDGEDTRPYIFRPYRGLLAFHGEHNRYFFGREAERRELFDDLRALVDANKPRFMVVAGASGTGKSSMVLAGVVPTLAVDADVDDDAALNLLARMRQDLEAVARRQPGGFAQEVLTVLDREATTRRRRGAWRCKILRPGTHPLDSLDAAVGGHDGGRLLLVVDQFEEIFTLTSDPEVRQRFARRLWSLSQGATGIHVVVTIRVDFLGHCGHLILDDTGTRLDRIAYDEAHRVFVAQMGDAQLRAAIERPAALVGLKLAPGLVDQIISAGREPGALPLIQYALDRLWVERHGRVIGVPPVDGDETNVVLNALKRWADQVIDGLDRHELTLARRLLTRLVDVSDDEHANTRRRVALATLRPRDAAACVVFDGLIDKLVEARLLVISNDAGTPTIEVAHEALIRRWARMREWLDQDRGKLGELKTLDGWVRECDERGGLLYGERLGYATEVVGRYPEDVSARARALVDASRRRAKLRQGAILGVAALFVVLGVVALFFGEAARRHEEEARAAEADARQSAEKARAAEADAKQSAHLARAAEEAAEASARRARDSARVSAANAVRETALSIGLLREIEAVDPDASATGVDGWSSAALAALDRPWIERVRLVGHEGMVLEASFGSDGARVVTASSDRHAFVWDARDGAKIAELGPHGDAVLSAALSSDGTRVVTTSRDGLVRLWEIDDPARAIVLTHPAADAEAGIVGAAEEPRRRAPIASFSPNAAHGIAVDDRGVGSLWELAEAPRQIAWESPAPLTSAAFSPDSSRLLTGHDDNQARVWDASTAALLVALPRSDEPYLWVGFDGERGVTATSAGKVTVWDLARGRSQQEITAFQSLGPAGDEERLLVGSAASSLVADAHGGCKLLLPTHDAVEVWSRHPGEETFRLAPRLPIAGGSEQGALPRYDARDDLLAALTPESDDLPETPLLLDAQGGVVRLVGHRRPVRSLDFAGGPTRLLTASEDSTARIWTRALPLPQSPTGLPEDHELLALGPDGRTLVSRAKGRDTVTIREIGGGERDPVEVSAGGNPRVVYRPGGGQVAIADAGATIVDLRTWSVLRVIGDRNEEGALDPVIHATYSDDGARLLLDANFAVTVWDPDTGERLNQMTTRTRSDARRGVIRSFFDLTQSRIHTILTDKGIASWNPADESEIARHPTEIGIPRGMTFAAHAQLLVVLTLEAQILLIQPEDGRRRAKLLDGDAALMAIDPAGRRVAGAETSGVIRVWDLDDMDEIAVLRDRGGEDVDSRDAEVTHLAFSPDGRRLLSAREDGTTRLWDVASGRLLVALRRGAVGALGFTENGEEALVLETDGALTRIPLASGSLLERLWRATRVCPSTDDRIAQVHSDPTTAGRDRARCEAMIRCLEPAGAAPFDRCLEALRQAQATGEPFDLK